MKTIEIKDKIIFAMNKIELKHFDMEVLRYEKSCGLNKEDALYKALLKMPALIHFKELGTYGSC